MEEAEPHISTLIKDLHALLTAGVEISSTDEADIAARLLKAVKLHNVDHTEGNQRLRLSKIGLPDRRLWYDLHTPVPPREMDEPEWRLRSMFGDITEELLLWLVEKAGHLVTDCQKYVLLDGIPGHIDCLIDGALVDVKSASPYGFRKFKEGTLFKPGGDPFGYVAQLSCYNEALGLGDQSAYWLVMDKSSGELCLRELTELEQINARERVKEAKELLKLKGDGPPRCYPLEPVGKSGNMALSTNCSWCPHKEACYSKANNGKGLRTFKYKGKPPMDLVVVKKEPKVPEAT